jgi:hypothetical protein
VVSIRVRLEGQLDDVDVTVAVADVTAVFVVVPSSEAGYKRREDKALLIERRLGEVQAEVLEDQQKAGHFRLEVLLK